MEQDQRNLLLQVEAKREWCFMCFACFVSVEFNFAFYVRFLISVRKARPLLQRSRFLPPWLETWTGVTRDISNMKRVSISWKFLAVRVFFVCRGGCVSSQTDVVALVIRFCVQLLLKRAATPLSSQNP